MFGRLQYIQIHLPCITIMCRVTIIPYLSSSLDISTNTLPTSAAGQRWVRSQVEVASLGSWSCDRRGNAPHPARVSGAAGVTGVAVEGGNKRDNALSRERRRPRAVVRAGPRAAPPRAAATRWPRPHKPQRLANKCVANAGALVATRTSLPLGPALGAGKRGGRLGPPSCMYRIQCRNNHQALYMV